MCKGLQPDYFDGCLRHSLLNDNPLLSGTISPSLADLEISLYVVQLDCKGRPELQMRAAAFGRNTLARLVLAATLLCNIAPCTKPPVLGSKALMER
eukprot:2157858-Pleurochrysis_carterae.AAC.1